MRIAVVGLGAVGGYFGIRLLQAGADVVFLQRPGAGVPVGQQHVQLASPFGDWEGTVRRVSPSDARADIVVVATKARDLAAALEAAAASARDGARVLPLLNGVRHLETLAGTLGSAPLLGGLAHLMVSHDGSGRITHSNQLHRFRFGQLSGGPDPLLDELAALACSAGVDAAHVPDIGSQMWAKFQMLAAFSALGCLARADVGTLMSTDNGRALTLRALDETRRIVAAEGWPVSEAHLAETRELLTAAGSPFHPSMLRDVIAGRATEADHVVGDMVRRGRRHGLDCPVLESAWTALQCHELRRGR